MIFTHNTHPIFQIHSACLLWCFYVILHLSQFYFISIKSFSEYHSFSFRHFASYFRKLLWKTFKFFIIKGENYMGKNKRKRSHTKHVFVQKKYRDALFREFLMRNRFCWNCTMPWIRQIIAMQMNWSFIQSMMWSISDIKMTCHLLFAGHWIWWTPEYLKPQHADPRTDLFRQTVWKLY